MQLHGLIPFAAGLPLLALLCTSAGSLLGAPAAAPVLALVPRGDPAPLELKLQTEDQISLAATYFGPRDVKQGGPAALLLHGAGRSRADLEQLAARLQKAGFAALTLDLRGHGESATEALAWRTLDLEAQAKTWTATEGDVQAGVDFLRRQPGVQRSRILLVGHASGCTLAVRHAKRDEKVRGVVLLSPLTEQLGATLMKDLVELGNLPLYLGGGADEAPALKRIAEAANKSRAAESAVETEVAKVDASGLLADPKLTASLVRWLKSQAPPEPGAAATGAKPIH